MIIDHYAYMNYKIILCLGLLLSPAAGYARVWGHLSQARDNMLKVSKNEARLIAKLNGESVSGQICLHHGDSLNLTIADFHNGDGLEYDFVWELLMEKEDGDWWSKLLSSSSCTCAFTVQPTYFPTFQELSSESLHILRRQLDEKHNIFYYNGGQLQRVLHFIPP